MDSPQPPSDIFVGRQPELERLRVGLADALVGHGQLFLISGGPGIGKTRLCDELAAGAEQQGVRVLWGRCWEGGGAPPFWPWVQMMRSYMASGQTAAVLGRLGADAAEIARMVPEIADVTADDIVAGCGASESVGSGPSIVDPQSAEVARLRQFDATRRFFAHAAELQPLMLVLDDLHAADQSSLELLRFVTQPPEETPLLIVGTYRDTDAERSPAVGRMIAQLGEQASPLALCGLAAAEVAQLAEHVLAHAPSPDLVAALYQRTEGHPFFVDELLRMLIAQEPFEAPDRSWQELGLPEQVREAIRRRLRPLHPEATRLLQLAAVIGREFDGAVVHAAAGIDGDYLQEPLLSGVIAAVGMGQRYRFAHALIRETLYDDLSPSHRTALHHGVATALEQLSAADESARIDEIAHHWFHAALGGDVGKALSWARRAGEHAGKILAYEEAVQHFERALQLCDVTESSDVAQRGDLLLALGNAQLRAGHHASAQARFAQAATVAQSIGAAELLAASALGVSFCWGDVITMDPAGIALLEEGLDGLPVADGALRALLLARLGFEIHYEGQPERSERLSAEAVEVARRAGAPDTIARVLAYRHFVLRAQGKIEESLAMAEDALHAAEQVADWDTALRHQFGRIKDLIVLGNIEELDRATEMYGETAARLHNPPHHLAVVATLRAMRAVFVGSFLDAQTWAGEAFTLAQQAQLPEATTIFSIFGGFIERELGAAEVMEALASIGVEQNPNPGNRAALAVAQVDLGNLTAARAGVEQVAVNGFRDVRREGEWSLALAHLAEVCAALDDRRRAEILYPLLLPHAQHNVVYGHFVSCGAAARYLGLLAATMGRNDLAAVHFREALARNARMGARPWLAHTQADYASWLLSTVGAEGYTEAAELLGQAAATAEELGMKGLSRRAVRLLDRVRRAGEGTWIG